MEPSSNLGPQPITVATGPQLAEALVVDSRNVYWSATQVSEGPEGGSWAEVMQCPKSGCSSPITLVQNDALGDIAVDDTWVYWTTRDAIMRVPIGGGMQTTFASTSAVTIAIDANDVYWTSGNAVQKAPRKGGNATTVVAGPAAGGIAVDGVNVYWTDVRGGTVTKAAKAGGNPTVLATGQSAGSLALDATNVYWTNFNEDAPGATVMTVPIAGGTPTVLASHLQGPYGIAVGRSSVYWTSDNAVKRVPIDGGPVTTVVPRDPDSGPMGIAVDEANVYWTDAISGKIMRLIQD